MTDKVEQALYFEERMLQAVKEEGARLDRSLSWCIQRAWKISRNAFDKFPSAVEGAEELPASPELDAAMAALRSAYPGGDKRKQTLYFPEAMLEEIKTHAERMDRSRSWVVALAWSLAEGEIRSLPAEGQD